MRTERGITFPRMESLIDLHVRTAGRELFELGTAVALAFSDPQGLKLFIKEQTKVDMSKLPRMLKATTPKVA